MFLKDKQINQNKDRVKKSKKQELRLASLLGGKRFSQSGAQKSGKYSTQTICADLSTDLLHIEQKTTEKEKMVVQREWFTKVVSGVTHSSLKKPAIIITFMHEGVPYDWIFLRRLDVSHVDKLASKHEANVVTNHKSIQISLSFLEGFKDEVKNDLIPMIIFSWNDTNIIDEWYLMPLLQMIPFITKKRITT